MEPEVLQFQRHCMTTSRPSLTWRVQVPATAWGNNFIAF